LPLSNIEDGHDGCLLVLRWVTLDDFLTSLHVLGIEFKGDLIVSLPFEVEGKR
jgi:hypothetical protein